MELKIITEQSYKEKWDEFVKTQPYSQFTQSWNWADFRKTNGNEIFRLAIEEKGKLISVCFFYIEQLPLGFKSFYCPRGPIISDGHDIKEELNLYSL